MLEVIIVDDEKIVLNGITKILKKDPDIHVAGSADNGIDGVRIIHEVKPDVVLTDIRMPGMTGLEMIRGVKTTLPDTVFIIFSGFNEFKYVKEAIGLGVIDYLEKPITVSNLRGVFNKAKKIHFYKQNYIDMLKNVEQVERVCVEKALRDLYDQSENEELLLKEILKQNPLLETATSICVMKVANQDHHTIEEYRSIVQSLTFDLIQKECIEVYSFYDKDYLLLTYFNMSKQPYPFLNKVQEQKNGSDGINYFIGVSRIHNGFYEMKNAFQEADSALKYALYLEETNAVSIDKVEYASSIPRQLSQNHDSLEFNFRVGRYDECREQIAEYLRHMRKLDVLPELFEQKCMELVLMMTRLLNEMGQEQMETFDTSYLDIKKMVSGEKILAWTLGKTEEILRKAGECGEQSGNKAIRTVKQYIESHYKEGMSLDELADQVHMSTTYLSMLFKKEEGVTYIRYLTKVRMEKAMDYLRRGNKAKDVCVLVGYHDYKYFSTQFKTYTGMTLEAYKKSFS